MKNGFEIDKVSLFFENTTMGEFEKVTVEEEISSSIFNYRKKYGRPVVAIKMNRFTYNELVREIGGSEELSVYKGHYIFVVSSCGNFQIKCTSDKRFVYNGK